MSRPIRPRNAVTVCYDGACSLCTESVARVQRLYRGRDINWVPYQGLADSDPELAARLGSRELGSALHVIEADGSVRSGAAAVLRIAEIVPRLRLFARLGRLPVVRHLVEPMYGLVARHRHRLSRLIRRVGSGGGSPAG
jgi:predicted DCC family thiol-disulfide oxidoreductase YuxK